MILPQMQAHWFLPWFPCAESNNSINGLRRLDLKPDARVHFYHGAYWTLQELEQYGALPAADASTYDILDKRLEMLTGKSHG